MSTNKILLKFPDRESHPDRVVSVCDSVIPFAQPVRTPPAKEIRENLRGGDSLFVLIHDEESEVVADQRVGKNHSIRPA